MWFLNFLVVNTSGFQYSTIFNMVICGIVIIPLAICLGTITNDISEYLGEKLGGILAATISNLPELIMGIWALRYGMIPMAKGALMGSIISNMLFSLGLAVIIGGVKYKEQKFNKFTARTNLNMLLLAFSSIVILATVNRYSVMTSDIKVSISMKASIILLIVYILGLIFSLITHRNLFVLSEEEDKEKKNIKSLPIKKVLLLIVMFLAIYFVSEKLISNAKLLVEEYDLSQQFLGMILIPVLGNIGENMSVIISALRNKINLSLETANGSSLQMALFVTPLMMIISFSLGLNMNLMFTAFEIIMVGIAIAMAYFVFQDGKTYWFEGAILIASYFLITIAYFYAG